MIYLAFVAGPRGPQPQLWHKYHERDHFVTPSDLPVVVKPIPLPAAVKTLDAAVAWFVKEAA